MYMGDRWVSSNLIRSTYVWLPLKIEGTTASVKNAVNWILNPTTGATSAGPEEKQYEGEAGTLSNGAKSQSCSGCSGGKAAGYLGGSTGGAVVLSNVQSPANSRTTLRIKHLNGDSAQRVADVSVNGKTQRVAFLPHGGGDPGTSVVHVDLKQGANEAKVSMQGGWGPDVDRVMVPQG
jgi:hypothetical protein